MNLKTLFVIITALVLSINLKAQTSYEYAVVEINTSTKIIEVSINGIEYKKMVMDKSEIKDKGDINAALKEISKMTKEGWEMFNANSSVLPNANHRIYTFYLKRKTN